MLAMLTVSASSRSSDLFMISINKDVCHVSKERRFRVNLKFMTWMVMVTMIRPVCQLAKTTTPNGNTLIMACPSHPVLKIIMTIMPIMTITLTLPTMTTPTNIAGEMAT